MIMSGCITRLQRGLSNEGKGYKIWHKVSLIPQSVFAQVGLQLKLAPSQRSTNNVHDLYVNVT